MASSPDFVEHVVASAQLGAALSARPMFGEYALYLDGKVVALVCDNQLFVKPTPAGRALVGAAAGDVVEASAYPGAKPSLLVDPDDGDLLRRLLPATAAALPKPKPKAARTAKAAPAKSKSPRR